MIFTLFGLHSFLFRQPQKTYTLLGFDLPPNYLITLLITWTLYIVPFLFGVKDSQKTYPPPLLDC